MKVKQFKQILGLICEEINVKGLSMPEYIYIHERGRKKVRELWVYKEPKLWKKHTQQKSS